MTAPRKRSPPKSTRARPAPVAVEDASPSLIAKLGGEVRTVLAWIIVAGGGVAVIVGGLNWYGQRQVQESNLAARVVASEAADTRLTAALEAAGARIVLAENKVVELASLLPNVTTRLASVEQRLSAIGPVRDQQLQGMSDRLRVVEAADVQQAERAAQLANTLSTIAARIEDMLRRMEGVERRLDRSLYLPPPAQRGDAPQEAPAAWSPLMVKA